jgi:pimeloyl-ACP methyl ester carboxylesterase
VEQDWVFQPGQFDGIKAPTLMLAGSESPASLAKATERAAAAIPHARVHILEGHGHFAHKTDPEMVSDVVRAFLAE